MTATAADLVVGGVVAPITTGYIVGATQSFTGAFLVAGVVLVIGIVAYVFILAGWSRSQIHRPRDLGVQQLAGPRAWRGAHATDALRGKRYRASIP
jgi:dipeptide/tripeptide permease